MRKIMLATDFSERSDRALRRAVILARDTGAALHLVHIVDDDRPRRIVEHDAAQAHDLLAELHRTLENLDGITCTEEVRLSQPFTGIAEAAADHAAELLVLGPHRRQLLRDAFSGTTAERAIRLTTCPILMVNGPPAGPWRHILLTTDFSDASRAALRRFASLKLHPDGARLSILHVFEAPALRLAMSASMAPEDQSDYLKDLGLAARRELGAFLLDFGALQAEALVRHEARGTAVEIMTTAAEMSADVMVIATQGKGAVTRWLLGSVAEQVLRDATVDVLVLPPTEAA